MRLRTRLLLWFLGGLAAVLVGFSTSLYLMASTYLYRQADERLEAALNTLVAAAEVNEDGVEWEPEERRLLFGRRTVEGRFFWQVRDAGGPRLDGSAPDEAGGIPAVTLHAATSIGRPATVLDRDGHRWRVLGRRLERPPAGGQGPVEAGESGEGRLEALVIEVGVSLIGVRSTLRNLGLALVGLSAGLWTLALGVGRRLSRRALRPVTAMARAAHAIGDGPEGRLPVPATGDELEGLARSFNALLDRLHESFERQRRFTGDASHQLRTPLTAIQGQVDLALRQHRDGEEYRRVLVLVQRRTRHLRQIVEALLFLARADAEVLRPELVPVDLSAWLPAHLRARCEAPRASDVKLESMPNGPQVVRAQPALLGELVDNLLENASKYSPPGTPIVVRVGPSRGGVGLSVEDQGVGISEEDVPHLFEPFYRSEAARRRGSAGLGLGLSVASRLAALFGATIDVESRPGRGSTFTVRFPDSDGADAPESDGHRHTLVPGS